MTSQAHAAATAAPEKFTRYQVFVIALLAFLQFTIILDFMILAPLGPILMHDLSIPTAHFGWAVSAYAFSAGVSGLLAAGFADRFDRKRLLMFFYTGFILGTLLCGIAPNYPFLLFARVVTGLFGGVIGSIVLTLVADLFPLSRRGRVMGFVQTAFAASQVLGLPLGLYLSNLWGWHAPFLMIAGVGAAAGVGIFAGLRPVREHLKQAPEPNPFRHLFRTVSKPDYLKAFAACTLLVTGGFMLMPFGSAFTVHNMGISFAKLPTIYLVTGICALAMGPLAGKLSDSIGKYQVFLGASLVMMVMVGIYTHLGITPLWLAIVVNVLLFAGITGRIVPSQALLSAVPEGRDRGAFMSVNASINQFAGGIAAGLAGLIAVQGADGRLERYDVLGYVVIGAMAITAVLMYGIHRRLLRRGYKSA
ncbi:MAG: arabinose efflux permease family protein [Fibrobacteria bacterium]|jgi:predicted MFS family arabinose efflux permease|nr:arabinose efflux permease family protein [Fibrobacteria bacterium]